MTPNHNSYNRYSSELTNCTFPNMTEVLLRAAHEYGLTHVDDMVSNPDDWRELSDVLRPDFFDLSCLFRQAAARMGK